MILLTTKLSFYDVSESRRVWVRLGNNASANCRSIPESKNNRYDAPKHHCGGVCGVGMLRSEIETSREILMSAKEEHYSKATTHTSLTKDKVSLAYEEVGGVHKSVKSFVMKEEQRSPT